MSMLQNPKIIGFLRGLGYAVLGTISTYLVSNLGTSGIFSTTTAGIIVGLVGIIDHLISNQNGGGVFGSIG